MSGASKTKMAGVAAINVELFRHRLKLFYEQWKNGKSPCGTSWEGVNAIAIDVGDPEVADSISSYKTAIQVWLFQTVFPDSLMVFLESSLYILVSERHSEEFEKMFSAFKRSRHLSGESVSGTDQHVSASTCSSTEPEMILLYKDKAKGNSKMFEKILDAFKKQRVPGSQKLKLGLIRPSRKDKLINSFGKSWLAAVDNDQEHFAKVDIAEALASIMGVKDEVELALMKRSATISNNIFNMFLREEIMRIVDGDLKVKHSTVAEKLEKCYLDTKYIKGNLKHVDICYPPILQSGGKYSMKINQVSNEDVIHYGVITCSFGSVYKSYCSNVIRTILINPSKEIKENYRFLQSAQEEVMKLLTPGSTFSGVHSATLDFVRKRKPELVEKLHPCLGFSIGILFNKQPLVITSKSLMVVVEGMVIHVSLAFTDLKNSAAPLDDPKSKDYALMIGDTVLIQKEGPAKFLAELKQKLSWISFEFEAENESKAKACGMLVETEEELLGRGARKAVLESRIRNDNGTNKKRQQLQKELMERLNIEAYNRVLNRAPLEDTSIKQRKQFASYKSATEFPKSSHVKALKIYVDSLFETVILPIFGVPVPFHIATFKSVSTSIEGEYVYFRLNFLNPSATIILDKKTTPSVFRDQQFMFVKELTFRSSTIREPGAKWAPSENLLQSYRLVKEMHKKYKLKVAEYHEMKNVSKQDALICFDKAKRTIPSMNNIIIRPTVNNGDRIRKRNSSIQCGILEAHVNGCRFRIRDETLDILYKNIRCAFFQPCDFELGAYIHFVLHHEIIISKKKYANVQFYTEVGEAVTDLGKTHNCVDRVGDMEEYDHAEKEQKKNLNGRFKVFCDLLENLSSSMIEFEEPLRELGFTGSPGLGRTSILLQPTTSCLINVTEWPPFVIPLEEIELIHFERVEFVLKTFDMVVIFKDYSRKVTAINAVPINRIEKIKSWLDLCEIHYTEGPASLNWPKILKTILADPEAFFETGGWTFLDAYSEGEDSPREGEEGVVEAPDSDEEYKPSDSESGQEEEEDDSGDSDYSIDSDECTNSGASSPAHNNECGSDESDMEGKSWDELEREATASDNKERSDSNSENPGNKRKSTSSKPIYKSQIPAINDKPKFAFSRASNPGTSGVGKPRVSVKRQSAPSQYPKLPVKIRKL